MTFETSVAHHQSVAVRLDAISCAQYCVSRVSRVSHSPRARPRLRPQQSAIDDVVANRPQTLDEVRRGMMEELFAFTPQKNREMQRLQLFPGGVIDREVTLDGRCWALFWADRPTCMGGGVDFRASLYQLPLSFNSHSIPAAPPLQAHQAIRNGRSVKNKLAQKRFHSSADVTASNFDYDQELSKRRGRLGDQAERLLDEADLELERANNLVRSRSPPTSPRVNRHLRTAPPPPKGSLKVMDAAPLPPAHCRHPTAAIPMPPPRHVTTASPCTTLLPHRS